MLAEVEVHAISAAVSDPTDGHDVARVASHTAVHIGITFRLVLQGPVISMVAQCA